MQGELSAEEADSLRQAAETDAELANQIAWQRDAQAAIAISAKRELKQQLQTLEAKLAFQKPDLTFTLEELLLLFAPNSAYESLLQDTTRAASAAQGFNVQLLSPSLGEDGTEGVLFQLKTGIPHNLIVTVVDNQGETLFISPWPAQTLEILVDTDFIDVGRYYWYLEATDGTPLYGDVKGMFFVNKMLNPYGN